MHKPSDTPSEGDSESQEPSDRTPDNGLCIEAANRRVELEATLQGLGWSREEIDAVLEAVDQLDVDPEDNPEREPTTDGTAFPSSDEVDQALEEIPDEIREKLEQLENVLGPIDHKAWLNAYGKKVDVPQDDDACAACGEPIRHEVFTVEPWGDVLRLKACGCRLWTAWEGPQDEDCPVCTLMQAPHREVLHTHQQPAVCYLSEGLSGSDVVTYRWDRDEVHFDGLIAVNTVPDELERV